ncbi:MAG: GDP-L-fucose synthase [Xanthomonadales bacterium]|jgi:GDP-L-fucose synthase|nr:GDP-L-fucose synthase [Xanthomonadales bacterium]
MPLDARIFVAGSQGLVGSAIVRALEQQGYRQVLSGTRRDLDLTDAHAVTAWFDRERPTHVFMAAAKVGGIHANNSYPVDFLEENLRIQNNVIHSAWRYGAHKLLFLGSCCIYPKVCPQPIKEEYLLTGLLEPTNEWYAIAKIAGIKLCQAYRRQHGFDTISLMPTNLYGPQDNFDLMNSHVVPALIRKFHEAKEGGRAAVTIWGTGKPRRELLYVDDMADAAIYLMKHYSDEQIINVGTGKDISISDLATLIARTVGFTGQIVTDASKPDGTMLRCSDVSRLFATGWRPQVGLEEGIRRTYRWYVAHEQAARGVQAGAQS